MRILVAVNLCTPLESINNFGERLLASKNEKKDSSNILNLKIDCKLIAHNHCCCNRKFADVA